MKFSLVAFAGIVFTFAAAAQQPPVQQPAARKFDPKLLQSDLQAARRALHEIHFGIYRYTPKAELEAAFDNASRQLDHPMTGLEFYRVLAPLFARIKCGHTSVDPPANVEQALNQSVPIFPFDVEVLDGKVYVFRDYLRGEYGLRGLEIREINGVPMERILSTMLAATPGDGDTETSRPWRIGHGGGFPRLLYLLAGIESPFQIELVDPATGKNKEMILAGVTKDEREKLSAKRFPVDKPDTSADFQFLEGGKIAVLTIRWFGGRAGPRRKPMSEYFDEVFRDIHLRNSKTLIIDVRNNGGGEDELGPKLLSFLLNEPFQYYAERILAGREMKTLHYANPRTMAVVNADGTYRYINPANSDIQRPSEPHFAGQVLALMNGGSFSTTSEFLSTLHSRKRATFIGEEAAGGYYGNSSGSIVAMVLPETQVFLRLPMMTYYLAVEGGDPRRGVLPDIEVKPTIGDLLTGKDPAMTRALEFAGERK